MAATGKSLQILAFFLFFAISAQAEDCWNSDRTFYDCSSNSGGAAGVSTPILGDTLESNSANLPSQPTPFGIEALLHDRSTPRGKPKVGFALVKGFDGLGFGLGAWSKGTFAAPDFPQHFLGPAEARYRAFELKEKNIPGIRLGTAIVLPKFFLPRFMRLSIGGSMGLGQVSGHYSPQLGAVMRIYNLGIGYSENRDQLATDLPRTRISVFSAGLFIRRIYLGYSYSVIRSSLNRTFSNFVGMKIFSAKWTIHGGWKFQKDHRGAPDDWYRAGLQRKIGKRFSLGYEYGYYRYSHSASMQFFF